MRLEGHWEFADGILGTISEPPDAIPELCPPGEWQGCCRTFVANGRIFVTYYIAFDEPHDDGSGDGPYRGAEIDREAIHLVKI